MSWDGTYTDPIYGGLINVCTTIVGGTTWAQGTFSEVGYMRGTVAGSTWTGEFWTAGYEIKQGTFALTLGGGGFSGSFLEKPNIPYNITSTRTSSDTPSDLKCMKADSSLLSANPPAYSFNGTWTNDVFSYQYVDSSSQQFTSSYGNLDVPYSTTPAATWAGFSDHNPAFLNGQVSTGSFYESGPGVGLELYVAKNASVYYASWWFVPRMADFNYTKFVDEELYHGLEYTLLVEPTGVTYDIAAQSSCLALATFTAEDTCFIGYTGTSSSSSSSSLSRDDVTGICLGVFGAMLIGAMLGFFFGKRAAGPVVGQSMASKDANKNKDLEMH